MYERPIKNYEGNSLEVKDGKSTSTDRETTKYTFKMDYYWMMGDNRHNSADSFLGVCAGRPLQWVNLFYLAVAESGSWLV